MSRVVATTTTATTTIISRLHRHSRHPAGCLLIPRSYSDFSSSVQNTTNGPALLRRQKDGIMTLTLNRPQQRHALNLELIESLHDVFHSIATSSANDIRAVVVQSTGPVFCSGHDLKELLRCDNKDDDVNKNGRIDDDDDNDDEENDATDQQQRERVQEIFHRCSAMMQLLHSIPPPTICAVQGLATAAGCQLAAACDVVLASPTASFGTPGVQIGLFCHTPAVELVRSIGIKRALDMLYTGRIISASQALDYGLVSRVIPDDGNGDGRRSSTDLLHDEAHKLAQGIASRSKCAMQLGKRTFYHQVAAPSLNEAYGIASQAMVQNMKTQDAQQGIQGFLSRRKRK
jgi:enoyl-CoA hydratase/carnithine racemase